MPREAQLQAEKVGSKEHIELYMSGNLISTEDMGTSERNEASSPEQSKHWERSVAASTTSLRTSNRKRGPPRNRNALFENPKSLNKRRRTIRKASYNVKPRVARQSAVDVQSSEIMSSCIRENSSLPSTSDQRLFEASLKDRPYDQPYPFPEASQANVSAYTDIESRRIDQPDGESHTQDYRRKSAICNHCDCHFHGEAKAPGKCCFGFLVSETTDTFP